MKCLVILLLAFSAVTLAEAHRRPKVKIYDVNLPDRNQVLDDQDDSYFRYNQYDRDQDLDDQFVNQVDRDNFLVQLLRPQRSKHSKKSSKKKSDEVIEQLKKLVKYLENNDNVNVEGQIVLTSKQFDEPDPYDYQEFVDYTKNEKPMLKEFIDKTSLQTPVFQEFFDNTRNQKPVLQEFMDNTRNQQPVIVVDSNDDEDSFELLPYPQDRLRMQQLQRQQLQRQQDLQQQEMLRQQLQQQLQQQQYVVPSHLALRTKGGADDRTMPPPPRAVYDNVRDEDYFHH